MRRSDYGEWSMVNSSRAFELICDLAPPKIYCRLVRDSPTPIGEGESLIAYFVNQNTDGFSKVRKTTHNSQFTTHHFVYGLTARFELVYFFSLVTSLSTQSGNENCSSSALSSISATINPSFCPRNSSTSQV